ncbi:hypothetical protein [Acinetobacter wuhouensis]|uniref:Uncharacterized protein n=1 Tax=Acinetobacter wuhouensis TaxID=1879050 RepID=A0A3G2T338_9GAMM|nr:hypothetical protein [Acinetobacter wuhouensis]AYO54405.1 hypothetical protein CDG68_12495 [Acinetobacter wuhouensis]
MENSLVIKNLQYFIGSRTENGKYSVFSPSMNTEQFKKYCIENLGLDTQSKDNSNRILLNIHSLLEGFTKSIVDTIRLENQNLFNKLLDHDLKGVLRSFAQDYRRIKNGDIDYNYGLRLEINKLIEHHLPIFLTTSLYKWEIPGSSGRNHENVLKIVELKNKFSLLINILCMSIMIEFKVSKNYFKDDVIIQENINQIKNHLNKVFLEPSRSNSFDQFYAYCLFKNPTLLQKFLKIQKQSINLYDCQRALNTVTQYTVKCNGQYMDETEDTVRIINDSKNTFDQVLDLMGIINMVEFMYDELKESCNTDNELNDQNLLTEFEIFFNK